MDGIEVTISNPSKIFFPDLGLTKFDLARYYEIVAEGALRGCRDRPTLLKRFPNGVDEEPFYQKRVPAKRPPFIDTVEVTFPSGRRADFLRPSSTAAVLWAVNLGCLELNPWNARAPDVDHPDELRVDLDPGPGVPFSDARTVALVAREVLTEHGLRGFPKTSGKRGIHVLVRIEQRWTFTEVRRAALAIAREIERRVPEISTSKWWKEERHGVFIDFNQNARDRTLASAYSIRPSPEARVSLPVEWDEVADLDPDVWTILTVPERYRERGDAHASIDDVAHDLTPLLDLADRQEAEGAEEAPYPPHFPKAEGEPVRAAPQEEKGLTERADIRERERRRRHELLVRAVRLILVRPPPHEARAVPEAPASLQMVVRDLGDELWPQRDPRGVLALRPSTRLVPFAFAEDERLDLLEHRASLRRLERRHVADVVHLAVVVDAEHERADPVAGLVQPVADEDAVRGASVFDLHHNARAGFVRPISALRDEAVEPRALEPFEPLRRHIRVRGLRRDEEVVTRGDGVDERCAPLREGRTP
jgi:bifunctional non-homologous end joining protein LigD